MGNQYSTAIELERLRGVLSYQPRLGTFTWLVDRGTNKLKGKRAGTVKKSGHRHIKLGNNCFYYEHRLAWLFMKGEWPPDGLDIDHEDGIHANNKWKNLRLATNGQNNWNNHRLYKNNTSGKRGVSWESARGGWIARVNVEGRPIHLGFFKEDKLKDAIAARRAGELKYFGKYAPK